MSAQDKLQAKLAEIEQIKTSVMGEISEDSKKEYKRITRENVNKVQTRNWYGSTNEKGQNLGETVEEIIQVTELSGDGFTIGFDGIGGHTSWVDDSSVDVIDILERGGFTVLSSSAGVGRKPPIHAHEDTFNYLTETVGNYPRFMAKLIQALQAKGFDIS